MNRAGRSPAHRLSVPSPSWFCSLHRSRSEIGPGSPPRRLRRHAASRRPSAHRRRRCSQGRAAGSPRSCARHHSEPRVVIRAQAPRRRTGSRAAGEPPRWAGPEPAVHLDDAPLGSSCQRLMGDTNPLSVCASTPNMPPPHDRSDVRPVTDGCHATSSYQFRPLFYILVSVPALLLSGLPQIQGREVIPRRPARPQPGRKQAAHRTAIPQIPDLRGHSTGPAPPAASRKAASSCPATTVIRPRRPGTSNPATETSPWT